MSFFEFPHTRTYDDDLGWLIKSIRLMIAHIENLDDTTGTHTEEITEIKDKLDSLIDTIVEPVKPWDPSIAYRMYQTVDYNGQYYTAIKDVPAGIGVGDTNYWTPSSGVMTVVTMIQENLEQLQRDVDALEDDLAAETTARATADTAINNELKWAQLADHDADYPIIETGADYVSRKGAVYFAKIKRNPNSITNFDPRYFMHFYKAEASETAPQIAKANMWRAMIAGPLRNKYVIDGVMYGTKISEAQYWFGIASNSSQWGYGACYLYDDAFITDRFNKMAFLIWSPLIYSNNPFTPPAQVMNAILSNEETFRSYIWERPHPRQVLAYSTDDNGQPAIIMIAFNGRHYDDVGFTCPDMIDYIQSKFQNIRWAVNMDGGGNTQLYVGSNRLNPPTNPYNRNTFAYIYADAREVW